MWLPVDWQCQALDLVVVVFSTPYNRSLWRSLEYINRIIFGAREKKNSMEIYCSFRFRIILMTCSSWLRALLHDSYGKGIQNNDDGIEVSFAIVAINTSQEVISCGSFCFYSFRRYSFVRIEVEVCREWKIKLDSNQTTVVRCVSSLISFWYWRILWFSFFWIFLFCPNTWTCGDWFAWLCHSFSVEFYSWKNPHNIHRLHYVFALNICGAAYEIDG